MGMQFSPMYQPVSTKTIKADGDLDVSPYDITAYDGHFDTVEADEFVGGVGNFDSSIASSYVVNVISADNGVEYGNIQGPTISNMRINAVNTLTPPNLPKNIGLFTVGNISGTAPNYQIYLTTNTTSGNRKFRLVCNGVSNEILLAGSQMPYTYDTGVSVLDELTATVVDIYSDQNCSAQVRIPSFKVLPAQ